MLTFVRELWKYRALWRQLARREHAAHYRHTVLGVAWSLLNPLLLMLVFIVVFGLVGRFALAIPHYPLFLLTGLLPWHFLAAALLAATGCCREHAALLLAVPFPRQVLPCAAVASPALHFATALLILLCLLAGAGLPVTLHWLWLPLLVLLQFLLLAGAGWLLAAFGTLYRDVHHLLSLGLAIGFYGTPVFYPIDYVPAALLPLYYLNPMVHFITAYRRVLLYGKPPGLFTLLFIGLFTACLLLLGMTVFRRLQARLPEAL